MKNFLVGFYGGFDYEKFNRDFREDFFGIEACQFLNQKEVDILAEESRKNNFNIGIHFSLFQTSYKLRDPLLLSLNDDEREEAYNAFEKEVRYASEINAKYILVHFPKPVLLDENLNWENWRFGSREEFMYQCDYDFEVFKQNCEDMFFRLSKLSHIYNVQIVLEHDAVNKYIYETTLLEDLFEKYPNLKMCLDTARLHINEKVNPNFDSIQFIRRMAKYTYLIHVSNVKVTNTVSNSHFPALPTLDPNEGWADIERYLKEIAYINKDVKILFEHRSDLVSDDELEECYSWVNDIFN